MAESEPESAEAPEPQAQPGQQAPPPSGQSSAEMARLLVKAVGTLPDDERDQVFVWLLSRGMSGAYGAAPLPGRLREVSAQLLSLQTAGGPGSQIGQQVVPVRFAADQHAQLRSWCSEHGFSMATVIRGLVARFLEGQLPARN
jgi:hypothetical protein